MRHAVTETLEVHEALLPELTAGDTIQSTKSSGISFHHADIYTPNGNRLLLEVLIMILV